MKQMGGDTVQANGTMGQREPVKDMARILGRWVDGMAARVFAQSTVDELAEYSGVPVVNALSDLYHPCQALADAMTIEERFGSCEGLRVAYVGDGNNVAHSLMITAARLGAQVVVGAPKGYEPNPMVTEQARRGGVVEIVNDPREAVAGADAAVIVTEWPEFHAVLDDEVRAAMANPLIVDGRNLLDPTEAVAAGFAYVPIGRGERVPDGEPTGA